jgi:hypothetical protein
MNFSRFLFILAAFCSFINLYGQSAPEIIITSIKSNEETGFLNVALSTPDAGSAVVNASTVKFYDEMDNGERCLLKTFNYNREQTKDFIQDTVSIMFLLDYSGSMNKFDRLTKSIEAIRTVVNESRLPLGSNFLLSAFHDEVFDSKKINYKNVESELSKYTKAEKDTDLFRAVIERSYEMKKHPGKKIVILLSDGKNDTARNPYYNRQGNKRYADTDVFKVISSLDKELDFLIFPIGLGNGVDSSFLYTLPELTKDETDKTILVETADDLVDIIKNLLVSYSSDYMFNLVPTCNEYRGESRKLIVSWVSKGFKRPKIATKEYALGSAVKPIYLGAKSKDIYYWLILGAIGLVLVSGLLALLIYLIPFFQKREFKRKYVVPYKTEGNRIKRDPITQDAFEDGDLVVIKCRQMTSLATWDALGHCPNYPNCMEYNDPCNGAGGEEITGSFFAQQGKNRILNWLWFGAVGGYVAWLFNAGSEFLQLQWLDNMMRGLLDKEGIKNSITNYKRGEELIENVSVLNDTALVGVFLGAFLILALTIAEEKGQTRKFSLGRVLVRGVIGLFLSLALFFNGFIFQYLLLPSPLLSGLVIWTVFGIGFGAILSINSSVELKRGMLGGVIAAVISFFIYFLILELVPNDGLAKLLSFIVLGAVLGALIVTVIANLEDFELVYLSPKEYTGMVKPISKWLKKGMEIYIGSMSKCYVFIKWEDKSVGDRHAKLVYSQSNVYIIPLYETLVNGVVVPENQKTPLMNNDIIQLGRESISKMQYKEKRG